MIPDEDPWPLPHRGDPLGLWVNLLRDQSEKLSDFYPERKRQLDHMGFLWLPAVFEEAPLEYDERLGMFVAKAFGLFQLLPLVFFSVSVTLLLRDNASGA
jgi:hypothetical protein